MFACNCVGACMSSSPSHTRIFAENPPTYRAFFLNHDGAVRGAQILEASTDDEAKAIAAALVNGHGVDLWERARFLASYPPLAISRGGGD